MGNYKNYFFVPPGYLLDSPRGRQEILKNVVDLQEMPSFHDYIDSEGYLDVVIVGGGLSGINLASSIFHVDGLKYVIVDPHKRLGDKFLSMCNSIGQNVMRSPYEHHPGCQFVHDCELVDFARIKYSFLTVTEREQVKMSIMGHRSIVPMDVFEGFVRHVIELHELEKRHIEDEVKNISKMGGYYTVSLKSGIMLKSRNVVFCTGQESIEVPDGYSTPWDLNTLQEAKPGDKFAVFGGGQTAATLTYALLKLGANVDLYHRGESITFRCADVPAEFFRPEGREKYRKSSSLGFKKSSVMHEYLDIFNAYRAKGFLNIYPMAHLKDRSIYVDGIRVDGEGMGCKKIILCFGLVPKSFRCLIDESIDIWDVDYWCAIHDGLYVLGAGAEAALGPAAKNIDGHRVGVIRILDSITRKSEKLK